jgi:DNA-binding beta-propeller fold protein YncE
VGSSKDGFDVNHSTKGSYMHLRTLLCTLALGAAGCLDTFGLIGAQGRPFEVWLIDQSDSPGRNYGGTLYIYDSEDLAQKGATATARERIDLGAEVAGMCNGATGANPVRPHMLLFNRNHTHAVLSFVASGHVVVFDAASRRPLSCMRTTQSATGRQAHAAYPSPDGKYIIIANQNGKRLERINADFGSNTFTHDTAATLDLAGCMTPSGAPCQAAGVRPDNAPICPIVDASSRYVFVTLRGGGMFVIDARQTPMAIVAEYDVNTVKGNGCGGTQVGGHMYINSGGRPGALAHLDMFGFDVYRFNVGNLGQSNAPNQPAPMQVFSAAGEHDSHGMAATVGERHIWVMDRHANVAEVISTARNERVNTVQLHGVLSSDPAPDLVDAAPGGNWLFVALRGSLPLSGDPHIATGTTPGLGIIQVDRNGSTGRLAALLRISNIDATGVERADAHAVRVRPR